MHRACLAKEIGRDQFDVRIYQVTDIGNGYAYLDYSYGDLDIEKTRQRFPLMSVVEAEALFFRNVHALLADGYQEIDETIDTGEQQEIKQGTLFLERYWIQGVLGSGGQGKVYLANDTQMDGSLVALKVLKQSGLSVEERFEAERRFAQEKALLSNLRLRHPAIPVIYDFQFINDVPVMSMQYIEGQSLQQKLDMKSPCPLAVACTIVSQLCDVLGFLHSQTPPIIYRDLKPSNVMIDANWNQLYLIDFGIARFFDKHKKHDTIAMGSPGYTSPELLAQQQTTPQSDIYSLGALFHCLITGQDPGTGKLFEFASTHSLYPDLSRSLDAIIGKMTAKDPARRHASMTEVAKAIDTIKRRANTRTVRVEEPKQGTVFVVSASLLLDTVAEDAAAARELYSATYRTIRRSGYGVWSSLLAKDPKERKEEFLTRVHEATYLLISVTPDLVQTPQGRWILDQVMKEKKQVFLAPMRSCHPGGLLTKRRLLIPAFVDEAPSPKERKVRLEAIATAIQKKISVMEKIA